MFGKILKVLGAGFLFAVIGIAIWIGFLSYKGSQLDKSSADYVNVAIPAIFNDWNYEELKKRWHPLFYKAVSEDQVKKIFSSYAALGKLENFEGCKGDSKITINTAGNSITARYLCSIKFEKDMANITVNLLQDNQQNWKILGLHISTKNFIPEKK